MERAFKDRGLPRGETAYGALTDHRFWDGRPHYWTGMAVKGMEDQDPLNFNCCPDLEEYEGEEVELSGRELRGLRERLRSRGHSHRAAGYRIGMGVSQLRQRLYGQRPFLRNEYRQLCDMAGIMHLRGGWEEEA
jgi:hypothetical protein